MTDLNPRWLNYCRAHGNTSDQQFLEDSKKWPGGVMTGFILWNTERLIEASKDVQSAFFLGELIGAEEYDVWLTAWVDERVKT